MKWKHGRSWRLYPEVGSAAVFRMKPVINPSQSAADHLWVRYKPVEAPPPTAAPLRAPLCALCSVSCAHGSSAPLLFRPFVLSSYFGTTSTMTSETVFLTALQPKNSVTTYGLPSNIQLENGSSVSDEVARVRRVQQQVQMRLAEKSTLPRPNGSASRYAMSGMSFKSPCNGSTLYLELHGSISASRACNQLTKLVSGRELL